MIFNTISHDFGANYEIWKNAHFIVLSMVFSVRAILFSLLFQTVQQIPNFFIDLKVPSVNVMHAVVITREELKKMEI